MLDCSKLPAHLKEICDGTHRKGDGTFHSLADRRTILARYLRVDVSAIEIEAKPPAQVKVYDSGIGTRLHAIIEYETGGRIECSECRDEVTKLNLMTPEQVTADQDEIAKGIVNRAKKKAPKFWHRWGAALAPETAKATVLGWIARSCWPASSIAEPEIEFITTIAVGMRVAKRQTTRWQQTGESIIRAGFPAPIIFAEPDAGIDQYADEVWKSKLGAFRSFTEMCKSLLKRSEEWLLLCEDDVDFSDHVASYIRTLNFKNEVVSLYTSGPLQNPDAGFSECKESFIGSHAVLLRRTVLQYLMESPVWQSWPKHDCVDKLIRKVTSERGIKLLTHNPSLCQHTGDTASIYPNRKLTPIRQAKDWSQSGPWVPPLVTLITPTGDRPAAFALCERWMSRQDYTGPIQWVVVDDGKEPTEVTCGQEYVRETPVSHHSLCRNLRSAIPLIKGDFILIVEDDDWYSPHYVSTMVGRLQNADLVGEVGAKYYYVRERKFYHFVKEHNHVSLCRTGMTRAVLQTLSQCVQGRNPSVDLRLWRKWTGATYTWKDEDYRNPLCVGIKGVAGRKSKNWKLSRKAKPDHNGEVLRQWVGADSDVYDNRPAVSTSGHDLTVLTCIFNEYDPIKNPVVTGESKYLCVTDRPTSDTTIKWECRQLEPPTGLSRGKAARFYKINSHLTGIASEWSFYIDGSMRLIVDPQQVIDDCLKLGDANLYLWHHHERGCIYAEASAVGNGVKETRENADRAAEKYRQEGFPENAGLYLGGIIVRRGECQAFNEAWWGEVEAGSVRDQISLPVAIAKSGITMLAHPPMTWRRYMIRHAHRSKKVMQRDAVSCDRFGVELSR